MSKIINNHQKDLMILHMSNINVNLILLKACLLLINHQMDYLNFNFMQFLLVHQKDCC